MKQLSNRLSRLERRTPVERPNRHGPTFLIGPCSRFTVEQARSWKPGESHAFIGLTDWLTGNFPPREPGRTVVFLPAHRRLLAALYFDASGLPRGRHTDDPACQCFSCVGWPTSAHVASEEYVCLCDACQERFDPPEFRQMIRDAEARGQALGWTRQSSVPACHTPVRPGCGPPQ
jgi:hypothetical protein